MAYFVLAATAALPWVVLPVLLGRRLRNSTSLDAESQEVPESAPAVSVIVPARNESRNIGDCLSSILANRYPSLEVILVNDQSTDDTGEIARRIAATDARLRVMDTDPLPAGWLGKPWACAAGATRATGDILCFNDADTMHRPDALVRSVNAMLRRKADLLSVYTGQRLETIWERLVQPHVFLLVSIRFGGTETVTQSPRAKDKLANGQMLFVKRAAYEALGGHSPVRGHPTEDIAMAQHFFAGGRRVVLTAGTQQVSTRMYATFRELVAGWGRTLFTGLRISMPAGIAGAVATPVLLVTPSIFELAPVVALARAVVSGLSSTWILWAAIAEAGVLGWWLVSYRGTKHGLLYALLHFIGAAVVLYICLAAIFRGRRISWKGRAYRLD